jgi:hypothetical protein
VGIRLYAADAAHQTHSSLVGAGIPGLQHGIDLETMNATFTATARVWDLEHGYYGTDPHLVAISAARLERREDAVPSSSE